MTPSTSSISGNSDMPGGVSSSAAAPMVDRMARSAHSTVDRVAETASSAVDRVAQSTGSAVGRVRSGVSDALSTARGKLDGLTSSRERWVDEGRRSVREHPLAAVGIGLAAGYLIARWLRD